MKRDMDLIRSLLITIEDAPPKEFFKSTEMVTDEHDHDTICEHLNLLEEAGYIVPTTRTRGAYYIGRLTWDGHEFLNNIRKESVWNELKSSLSKYGSTVSMAIIGQLSQKLVQAHFGL